jgi:TRAP-type mannitol/chloroaromatic compound transport system permease large subunit
MDDALADLLKNEVFLIKKIIFFLQFKLLEFLQISLLIIIIFYPINHVDNNEKSILLSKQKNYMNKKR